MSRHLEILSFWFGNIEENDNYLRDRGKLWFGGAPETDSLIRRKFEDDVANAAAGSLIHWEENPLQCLALILLLDQFALNIYRGTPRSFEVSSMALPVAQRAIEEKIDQRFHPVQRVFFYLPLEHSENLADQERALALFQSLKDSTQVPVLQKWIAGTEWWAEEHRKVIERFGRFPGRNAVLGRPSTPAENEYIAKGGSPF